jgi:hypothetical protein
MRERDFISTNVEAAEYLAREDGYEDNPPTPDEYSDLRAGQPDVPVTPEDFAPAHHPHDLPF